MFRQAKTYIATSIAILLLLTPTLMMAPISVRSSPLVPPREKTLITYFDTKLRENELWNPNIIGYSAIYTAGLIWGVYEYLVYTNLLTGEIIPWLATGINYTKDYTSLIVYLRKGVKWSDGVPFTADDVIFTYDMMLKQAPKLTYSPQVASVVNGTRKIDDYTVEILLKGPNPRFHLFKEAFPNPLIAFSLFIVAKHIWEKVADPLAFKNNPPIGTGPYKLVEATETRVLWQRRDDWWGWDAFGVRPAPEYIEGKYVAPVDVILMSMARDELDMAGPIAHPILLELIKTNPYIIAWSDVAPYAIFETSPQYLMFNMAKYPWSIREVRWAVSYALERTKIIAADFGGPYADPGLIGMFNPKVISPDYRAVFMDVVKKYDASVYDPTKAIALLEGLGFKRGTDGIFVTPNGTRLAPEIIFSNPAPLVGPVIRDCLKAVGIDAIIRGMEYSPFVTRAQKGEFDLGMRWQPCALDPFLSLQNMHGKYWVPIGTACGWNLNHERFKNATYDAILDEWERTLPDDPKSLELFKKAVTIYLQELPAAPLYAATRPYGMDTKYWINWPTDKTPYVQIQLHWGTFKFVISGYPSPKTGEWIGGLRPRNIETATVYLRSTVRRFRGIDLTWYGPFKSGDAARIPVDDAEFLIRKGLASYSPPEPAGLEAMKKDLAETKANVATLTSKVDSLSAALTAQVGTLTTIAAVLGVGVMMLAIALILVLRRK